MASKKEAVVIILDVGRTMSAESSASSTHLERALKAINMLVQQKMLFGVKDEVGLVLIGTEKSDNALDYKHVSVVRDVTLCDVNFLRTIEDISPGHKEADFIDGLIVAMDILQRKVKYDKRIFLVTDGGCEVCKDGLKTIIDNFESIEVKLNIIGIDVDVDDDEVDAMEVKKESKKSPIKLANEKLLKEIAESVNGVIVGVHQALDMMSYFRSRSVLQRTVFRGTLDIGNEVAIPVYAYTKTKEQTFPTMKKISKVAEQAAEPGSCAVRMSTTYHSIDDMDTEIDSEAKVKGFKYGKSLVQVSSADEAALKYVTEREAKLIGFTRASSIPRQHYMGSTEIIVSAPGNDEAQAALSSLIHALAETDSVAIIRYVKRKNGLPQLGCLTPQIKAFHEFLYYHKLPFVEDMREYPFASLDLKNIRPSFAPSTQQLEAAEALINSLDLMSSAVDEDGDAMEALKPKHTFNPVLQRFYQCVQQRAMSPDAPVTTLDPTIAKYANPDKELFATASKSLQHFSDHFPLERAESDEKKNRTYWSDTAKMNTEIKLDSYAPNAKKKKQTTEEFSMDSIVAGGASSVGSVNPVKDFSDMLSRRDVDLVDKAIEEMQQRIVQLVNDSIRDQLYDKALDCLVVLREGCVKEEEPDGFNKFLKNIRTLFENKRRDAFWQKVVDKNISLIHDEECDDSSITKDEATAFLTTPQSESKQEEADKEDDEVDDLFDQIE